MADTVSNKVPAHETAIQLIGSDLIWKVLVSSYVRYFWHLVFLTLWEIWGWCSLHCELPFWFLLTWWFPFQCINFFLVNTFDGFWNTSVLSFFNVLCFLLVADIDGNTFWSHPFNSLCHPKQLEEFIVMECSIVRDIKRSAGAGMISKKVSSTLFTLP